MRRKFEINIFYISDQVTTEDYSLVTLTSYALEDGILIGSVPNNFGIIGGLVTALSNIFDKTHCSTYSPNIWYEYFTEVGFSEVSFFGEVTLGRNRSFYVKRKFWKFVSFNLMFVCER